MTFVVPKSECCKLTKKMLENRPEDALDSLVEIVETVETVETVKMAKNAFTALTGSAFTAR